MLCSYTCQLYPHREQIEPLERRLVLHRELYDAALEARRQAPRRRLGDATPHSGQLILQGIGAMKVKRDRRLPEQVTIRQVVVYRKLDVWHTILTAKINTHLFQNRF